jgi:hypothetical protein
MKEAKIINHVTSRFWKPRKMCMRWYITSKKGYLTLSDAESATMMTQRSHNNASQK